MSGQACEEKQVLTNKQTETSDNDSEEGSRHEDQMALEESSVMVRMGPNSVDMTEEELELFITLQPPPQAAFSQLSLAFRCDQYTLCQRLEMEEHARDNAEDNLKLEVERGMEVLETLKGMCLDIKRAGLLQHLELSLNIIGGTIGRISKTAEVLGAVHQEAKVSRAVELMVAHVENLKRRHVRNSIELEEMKKQMEKSSRERHVCEQREETEAIEKLEKDLQKPQLRRRISTNIIAKQIQRQKVKESEAILSSVTSEISEEIKSTTKKPDHTDDCQMNRGQEPQDDSPSQTVTVDATEKTSSQIHPKQTLRLELDPTFVKKRRPLMQGMYHCRWIILAIYLTVLCSIIILAILVWLLQTPILWM
ncbi:hypothetical protein cypCar_00022883 [Cyprinus carpio]|nr:hypothetical protein cypCar_00022883 [Cyprinus carpio]